MKPLNYKHETNLALKFLIIFFAFIVVSMMLSCAVQKPGNICKTMKVTSIKGYYMTLDNKYLTAKCDTCKVDDSIVACKLISIGKK